MNRRNERRVARAAPVAAPRSLVGFAGLDNDTSLTTAAPGGPAGDGTGLFVAMVVRPLSFAAQAWATRRLVGSLGWIHGQSTSTLYRFGCYDATNVLVNSPTYDITADVNKVITLCGVYDATHVRLYRCGVEVGSGTAITGYSPAPAAATLFGGAGSTTPQFDFFGAVAGNGAPSAANILAWHNAVVAARAVVDMPGVPGDHLWRPIADANIADSIGADTLSKAGSGHALVSLTAPVWG